MDAIRVNENTRVNQVSSRTQLVRSDSNLIGFFIGDKMKRIPLTQGQFAIVDDEDFDYLNQWKWYAKWNKSIQSFYAVRSTWENSKAGKIFMSREILGLNKGDKRQADHKDHVTLDNRRSNLRIVTRSQNQWNRKYTKGYYWNKTAKKYEARIRLNYKRIYLGLFQTTKEAHKAYLQAQKQYHKF